MKNRVAALVALFVASSGTVTQAAVVSGAITGGTVFGTGSFLTIAPPPAVGSDNFNDSNLRAFNERQGVVLANPLSVDTLAGAGGASGSIAAGSVISSDMIVFDPTGTQSDSFQPTVSGNVTFDAPILGVIWRDQTLIATNGALGAPGVTYLTPAGFGLDQGSDFFTIGTGVNANRLTINLFSATSPGDVVRVITGRLATPGVPEPATWLSMILGFGVAGTAVRRWRRSPAATA